MFPTTDQSQTIINCLTEAARRAGVTDAVFFDAMGKNAGYSGLTKLKEPKLKAGDFSPQFSVKHMSKDMRLALHSPHHARIVEHIEFARRFFPELDGLTIRIGLAQKPGVLGWGSLDPERPGIWVRPRRLHLFTDRKSVV